MKSKSLHMVAFVLVVVGGLNLGLAALGFNVLNMLLVTFPTIEKLVYVLEEIWRITKPQGKIIFKRSIVHHSRKFRSWRNAHSRYGSLPSPCCTYIFFGLSCHISGFNLLLSNSSSFWFAVYSSEAYQKLRGEALLWRLSFQSLFPFSPA